jgi:holin-like protein
MRVMALSFFFCHLIGVGYVKRNIRLSIQIMIQILILYGLSLLGNVIVKSFHLPLPGNLVGMLILFLLLMVKAVPLCWVEGGSSILLKHLSLFFIPIAVGLMNYGNLFLHQGWLFFLLILISLWAGICTTGGVSQFLVLKQRRDQGEYSGGEQ